MICCVRMRGNAVLTLCLLSSCRAYGARLVGFVLKFFKEFSHADAYSRSMIAFQVADLTGFVLAMALIL